VTQQLVCTFMQPPWPGNSKRWSEEEEDAGQEEAWREGGSGYCVGCRARAAHGVRSASPLSHICRSAREEHRKRNFLPRIVESTAGGDGVRVRVEG